MTPEKSHEKLEMMLDSMEQAKGQAVFVGLPADKVGGKIYGDGQSIMTIGAIHEFGKGHNPMRSFLRTPLIDHNKELTVSLAKSFEAVNAGKMTVDVALGRLGAMATNISKKAFRTKGFGKWQDIKQSTKDRKGSSAVLIDTGTLRNAITWSVRDD